MSLGDVSLYRTEHSVSLSSDDKISFSFSSLELDRRWIRKAYYMQYSGLCKEM